MNAMKHVVKMYTSGMTLGCMFILFMVVSMAALYVRERRRLTRFQQILDSDNVSIDSRRKDSKAIV